MQGQQANKSEADCDCRNQKQSAPLSILHHLPTIFVF
jgi:hypothetical protein